MRTDGGKLIRAVKKSEDSNLRLNACGHGTASPGRVAQRRAPTSAPPIVCASMVESDELAQFRAALVAEVHRKRAYAATVLPRKELLACLLRLY